MLIALLIWASGTHALVLHEDIGQLRIHDLLLRPSFTLSEPNSGDFSIGESSFALRWELEDEYVGVIRLGPRPLMNPVARYTSTVNDDITLVEAFAEYNSPYGRIRLGRLPVEFGFEGRLWERDLIFPRSLLFSNRAMMLRDVGLSYDINQNHWFTGFVIHDGESNRDLDGLIWFTARWGYRTGDYEIGAVGQTGSTKPAATDTSGDTLAGVDPTLNEKWRIAGLYGALTARRQRAAIEMYGGQVEQQTRIGQFRTGHADYGYDWTPAFATYLRVDLFDPNLNVDDDMQTAISLAFVLSNRTHSSNLILVGTSNLEEGHQVANDQISLIWSLSPNGIVRF